ncbi:hypothetical protein [Cutibacterium acnes]|uniref:hypothetical protein n=1 Tax=Cutibacterium acnes TaxID=1747 RepID=UPI000BFBD717|nr:hypothetical protein [Cutibacterium acnes]PGF30894.1 hypothetical protein B1B08_03555 [Cutibacterium acnes subsp. defendens]
MTKIPTTYMGPGSRAPRPSPRRENCPIRSNDAPVFAWHVHGRLPVLLAGRISTRRSAPADPREPVARRFSPGP